MDTIDQILDKLQVLVKAGRFEQLETDSLEIKSVPSDKGSWKQVKISANAFLNTRGGIILLGIKEEGKDKDRRYVLTGWRENAEGNARDLCKDFQDRQGHPQDLKEYFPAPTIRPFLDKQIALIIVDELPADRKFVFYEQEAYKRNLTGDQRILEPEIERQEEYREEWREARELVVMEGTSIDSLDLDKLNDYIVRLNSLHRVETIKATLDSARPFLDRKSFLKDGKATLLGMLVCGAYPEDMLAFRCQVHGYVDIPGSIAQDNQDFADNILPLMDSSYKYLLRNIQVGIGIEGGGTAKPQYPDELLRETINNALAHRNYSINKQAIIAIRPGLEISIKNPGAFRRPLLIEALDDPIPIRRLIPEAKPRNPKLAGILRVYRKWEGRGIGMATMVDLCLENKIDLPFFKLYSEEVELVLRAGKLLNERMERLFLAFDRYIEEKLLGNSLTIPHKLILSYLMKSEWENKRSHYTILLTRDNNHSHELDTLEESGLIQQHPSSTSLYPIYVADRQLMVQDHQAELRSLIGPGFDALHAVAKEVLSTVYRFNHYSKQSYPSAKQVTFSLWFAKTNHHHDDVREFDRFYRQIRYFCEKLHKEDILLRADKGYELNVQFLNNRFY